MIEGNKMQNEWHELRSVFIMTILSEHDLIITVIDRYNVYREYNIEQALIATFPLFLKWLSKQILKAFRTPRLSMVSNYEKWYNVYNIYMKEYSRLLEHTLGVYN